MVDFDWFSLQTVVCRFVAGNSPKETNGDALSPTRCGCGKLSLNSICRQGDFYVLPQNFSTNSSRSHKYATKSGT